ncbi:MAG: hypothetical protein A3A24_01775 [Candidatus Buchananbacteria bacterium RIFCSPLOWO2_01_FULL_46_12]|uniref:Response regulatory domain-containing protein n=1 Tax=Candidatus Buchananbacteria bacterium RIFCSPLOWO2_01_FULL_46_12 TaxID=1797546 RepID=A0A1G1YRN3_9BACT|nr:MAG: hypothetical protein A3A24_01775 [Candidatus Buchananbacteria bacterium RIFCSPLOWO2_01_FULL_46_12]
MKRLKSKILIVEDDPLLRELYQLKLAEEGFAVFTAQNGEEGFAIAAREVPELILLDIMMPKVDGYEMLKKVKHDSRTNKIPVIIFSNLSQREEIEKGLRLGADDFIVKTSLTPLQLAARVRQYF